MSDLSGSDFPRLTASNHQLTSPSDPDYNCIAWALGDTEHWWQPGLYWPISTPHDDFGIAVLEQALRALGFEDCGTDDRLQTEYEKVAIYGNNLFYTHAAKQTPTGKWSSKLGKAEDIQHDTPDDVAGGIYGEVVEILRRRIVRES
jgi:hypothetical protein